MSDVDDTRLADDDYLRARGWKDMRVSTPDGEEVQWDKRSIYGDYSAGPLPTAEAVAMQLEEDRRLYNFVRDRSDVWFALLYEPGKAPKGLGG